VTSIAPRHLLTPHLPTVLWVYGFSALGTFTTIAVFLLGYMNGATS
jgi:hypothetical protein